MPERGEETEEPVSGITGAEANMIRAYRLITQGGQDNVSVGVAKALRIGLTSVQVNVQEET